MTTSNLPTVYVVERIVFDWSTDDGIDVSDADKERALCAAVGRWTARDEDHLLSQISDATGWCIKDISYLVVADADDDLKDGEMVADDPVLTCQCPCGCTNQAHESKMDDDGTTIRCPECAATAEG